MNHYAILADDFADAGGCAVHFAAAGIKTALSFDRMIPAGILKGHDAVALCRESHLLRPDEAVTAMRNAIWDCRDAGAELYFLAAGFRRLRNLGADLEVMLKALAYPAAMVCPAAPGDGVVISDGVIFDRGKAMGRVADLLAAGTGLSVGHLSLGEIRANPLLLRQVLCRLVEEGCRLLVPDATEEEDLRIIGKLLREAQDDTPTLLPRLLPAGAGALAAAFAGPALPADLPVFRGRLLAVSAGPGRFDAGAWKGFRVLELDMKVMQADPATEIARLLGEADEQREMNLLLLCRASTGSGENRDQVAATRRARILGEAAKVLCVKFDCPRLYVADSDSAAAVAAALGIKTATLCQRRIPGAFLASCHAGTTPVRWFSARLPAEST